MKKYLVKRLIQLPIILLGVIAVTFLIVQFTPGDPAVKLAGSNARPEDIEAIREQLGLNKPVLEQFVDYFVNIFHGDFGRSFVRKTEIGGELMTALVNTVYLIVFARIWSVIAAIPLGIVAAIKQNTWIDKACMTLTLAGVSIPQFWLGLMLMKFFCMTLGIFPISGMGDSFFSMDGLMHAFLPALMLGLPQMASISRLTRSEMLEVMRQDYIRTAKAKGLKYEITPFAKEAFVFFVNSKNSIKNITSQQIRDIYAGKITDWSQIDKRLSGKIKPFQRNQGSGSQTMLEKIMGKTPIMPPLKEDRLAGMGGIINDVANYRNYQEALGFTFRYFSTEMFKNGEIKLLAVDGIAPTVENIRDGTYPFIADCCIITVKPRSKNVGKIVNFLFSPAGKELIEKTGYVAIPRK